MKILPIYKNKILSLPAECISEKLSTASKDELKVLLAVYLEQEFEQVDMAAKLDMTENAFKRALSTWEKAGVIAIDKPKSQKKAPKSAEKPQKEAEQKKTPKVEVHTTLPHYTSTEVAVVVETKNGCSELIDSCQQILGKMFNASETAIVVGLVDHLGLSNDYVMLLCSHAASMDKRSVRYIEKLALHFYDLDVRSVIGLEEELNAIEDRASLEAFVRNIFGLGKRALIKKEKEYISAWSDKYKFQKDIIQRAYEVTVAKTNEPKMSYTNAVLENWYAAGYKTLEDIDKAEAEWKDNKKSGAGSFITDDFYEDALMRSYGSDNNNKAGE